MRLISVNINYYQIQQTVHESEYFDVNDMLFMMSELRLIVAIKQRVLFEILCDIK